MDERLDAVSDALEVSATASLARPSCPHEPLRVRSTHHRPARALLAQAKGDLYEDIRNSVDDMRDELHAIKEQAGRHKARDNVAKATRAVLHLADTFDMLDLNSSGAIDVAELRRGLHHLGMDSHSAQANAIIERYAHHQTIDIKTFTTLVRDIHLLLTFDRDGSGSLDTDELKPALEQLGLPCSDRHVAQIVRAWDADNSGRLDLLEASLSQPWPLLHRLLASPQPGVPPSCLALHSSPTWSAHCKPL